MRRLCVLTQYYPPEMGAPQARLSELACWLQQLEWQVEILTALPNYPTGKVFQAYRPDQACVEEINLVKVVRVPLFTANQGFIKRIRCYLSFAASARKHGPRLCSPPDILYVESPPLFIGCAAVALSRKWACPYVFNVSDLWPESAIRMRIVKPGLATAIAERMELYFYRSAAGVTGQSQEIIDSVRNRVPGIRAEVFTNGVDSSMFGKHKEDAGAREVLGTEPGPVFVYAGLFGLAQGLDQILDLALTLPSSVPGRFVLIGDGPVRTHLTRRVDQERIDRVRIIPPLPRSRIPGVLASADAAIISLGTDIPGAVPSKIYEAMASSLPILLIADGESARRVRNAGCGLTARPGDSRAILDAWTRLATSHSLRRRLGISGRIAATREYNRAIIARRLDNFLRDTLELHRGSLDRISANTESTP